MYRVSREGRRSSAANGPDTPPRPHKQRSAHGASYKLSSVAGRLDRLSGGNPRVKLGLKIAAALAALLCFRRLHRSMCAPDISLKSSQDNASTPDFLRGVIQKEEKARKAAEGELADCKSKERAKAGLPSAGSAAQQWGAETEAQHAGFEESGESVFSERGPSYGDLKRLVEEKEQLVQEAKEDFGVLEKENEELKKKILDLERKYEERRNLALGNLANHGVSTQGGGDKDHNVKLGGNGKFQFGVNASNDDGEGVEGKNRPASKDHEGKKREGVRGESKEDASRDAYEGLGNIKFDVFEPSKDSKDEPSDEANLKWEMDEGVDVDLENVLERKAESEHKPFLRGASRSSRVKEEPDDGGRGGDVMQASHDAQLPPEAFEGFGGVEDRSEEGSEDDEENERDAAVDTAGGDSAGKREDTIDASETRFDQTVEELSDEESKEIPDPESAEADQEGNVEIDGAMPQGEAALDRAGVERVAGGSESDHASGADAADQEPSSPREEAVPKLSEAGYEAFAPDPANRAAGEEYLRKVAGKNANDGPLANEEKAARDKATKKWANPDQEERGEEEGEEVVDSAAEPSHAGDAERLAPGEALLGDEEEPAEGAAEPSHAEDAEKLARVKAAVENEEPAKDAATAAGPGVLDVAPERLGEEGEENEVGGDHVKKEEVAEAAEVRDFTLEPLGGEGEEQEEEDAGVEAADSEEVAEATAVADLAPEPLGGGGEEQEEVWGDGVTREEVSAAAGLPDQALEPLAVEREEQDDARGNDVTSGGVSKEDEKEEERVQREGGNVEAAPFADGRQGGGTDDDDSAREPIVLRDGTDDSGGPFGGQEPATESSSVSSDDSTGGGQGGRQQTRERETVSEGDDGSPDGALRREPPVAEVTDNGNGRPDGLGGATDSGRDDSDDEGGEQRQDDEALKRSDDEETTSSGEGGDNDDYKSSEPTSENGESRRPLNDIPIGVMRQRDVESRKFLKELPI